MKKWTLNSWKNYPVKHIPKYEDEKELSMVLKKVSSFPPLVFAGESRALKKSLAQVAEGKAFLLQGCLLYTSPSPRDGLLSRMPSSA